MLGFLTRRSRPQEHPLLDQLTGQSIIHTRVAARGTRTVTARGWTLSSRIQRIGGSEVGLRDPRLLGAAVTAALLTSRGELTITLRTPAGTTGALTPVAPWRLDGDHGAYLAIDETGDLSDHPPGRPRFATAEALADLARSDPSGIEQRLLQQARRTWLHPGHVVEALTAAGALEDEEFERRGPILLSRMLARGELRAGFVIDGRFSPWDLSLAEVVEHIGTTWSAIGGRVPTADMIAWFELTGPGRGGLGPTGPQAMPPGMSGYDSPGVVGGFR